MAQTRRLITSAEVHEASRGDRRIEYDRRDLLTAQARDDAARLGVALVQREVGGNGAPPKAAAGPGASAVDGLEDLVRSIVTSMTSGATTNGARTTRPVVHVDGRSVRMDAFPLPGPPPELDCRLADVVTAAEHGAPMAAGFMSLHAGSFPWTLTYDEIEYVIEGELHIGLGDRTLVGRPGDVLYVPKGSDITFGTPSWAKFLYVTHPAEWGGGAQ